LTDLPDAVWHGFQPDLKALSREDAMLDENAIGIEPTADCYLKPLVAVFPHPYHGRLVERVMMMVSNVINFKGCRYKFAWKNNDIAYYNPAA
jgi:hypothetical protein